MKRSSSPSFTARLFLPSFFFRPRFGGASNSPPTPAPAVPVGLLRPRSSAKPKPEALPRKSRSRSKEFESRPRKATASSATTIKSRHRCRCRRSHVWRPRHRRSDPHRYVRHPGRFREQSPTSRSAASSSTSPSICALQLHRPSDAAQANIPEGVGAQVSGSTPSMRWRGTATTSSRSGASSFPSMVRCRSSRGRPRRSLAYQREAR